MDREASEDEARLIAEYERASARLVAVQAELSAAHANMASARTKADRTKIEKDVAKIEKEAEKPRAALAERDQRIAEVRKRADEERQAIRSVGAELVDLYADPAELTRHARVVDFEEIVENDYNLNISRYVETFEPEEEIDVATALAEVKKAETERADALGNVTRLMREAGYGD